jgi:hypothetical protein
MSMNNPHIDSSDPLLHSQQMFIFMLRAIQRQSCEGTKIAKRNTPSSSPFPNYLTFGDIAKRSTPPHRHCNLPSFLEITNRNLQKIAKRDPTLLLLPNPTAVKTAKETPPFAVPAEEGEIVISPV